MRFRLGLAIGFAAGYVLGARAGRERYEQIRGAASRLWESRPAERVRAEVSNRLPDAVSAAAHRLGELRRHEPSDGEGAREPIPAAAIPG